MKLIVSVDTEEDNWLPFSDKCYTTRNIEAVPQLQRIFSEVKVRPTYLITYPVATDPGAAAILGDIGRSGLGEIGTHCHPWSQPPFEEAQCIENSMLCNLPGDLQVRKIEYLHQTIQDRLGLTPTSFRSGRWGYSPHVARALRKLNYKVDSSVTAYTDWTAYHGPDFSLMPPKAYRFDAEHIYQEKSDGALLEIPASVGYLQSNFHISHRIYETIRRSPLRRLRLLGMLHRAGLLRQVPLSPEISTLDDMVKLVVRLREQNFEFVTMWFHSPALVPGLTPFVQTKPDAQAFLEKIRRFFLKMNELDIKSITLTEAANDFVARTEKQRTFEPKHSFSAYCFSADAFALMDGIQPYASTMSGVI